MFIAIISLVDTQKFTKKKVVVMLHTMEDVKDYINERSQFGIKPGLHRIQFLLKQVGNPEKAVKAIHVAGTNGKGSTIQFLQDALEMNGYEVGVFSSPSFTGIQGHFLINRKAIEAQDLVLYMNELIPFIKQLDRKQNHPTAFEILTVIAFLYFRRVDIAIIETGMGGRLDTTNCFTPVLSIITSIAKDHMHFLGSTIRDIAYHKAGIIKHHIPVIIGDFPVEALGVMKQEAQIKGSSIMQLNKNFFIHQNGEDITFEYGGYETSPVTLNLKGRHQIENAAIAFVALQLLQRKGYALEEKLTMRAIRQTVIPGRFEKISTSPFIIIDSAHNLAGMRAFLETVQQTEAHHDNRLIFAGFKDKQLYEMIQLADDFFSELIFTTFEHERAAPVTTYSKMSLNAPVRIADNWQEVVDTMYGENRSKVHYYITGSHHFIMLVRQFIFSKKR